MLDDGGLSDDFRLKYVIQALRDWKIWVNMFITIGIFTPLYSISLFLPTIIKELGYTANESQLMTVPVYVLACICTICGGLASDKAGQRGLFLMGFALVAITGFVMLISSSVPRTQYAGTFLAASGRLLLCSSCSQLIDHRHIPLCSTHRRMEQQQHRWKPETWRRYRNASRVW
jgi:nitrate/nitrite transporter NarK